MKRINIQRDVESRKSIEQELPVIPITEQMFEPVKEEQNAESETIQEHEADSSPSPEPQPKKRRRKTEGDI